jgi:hypothetical protein
LSPFLKCHSIQRNISLGMNIICNEIQHLVRRHHYRWQNPQRHLHHLLHSGIQSHPKRCHLFRRTLSYVIYVISWLS